MRSLLLAPGAEDARSPVWGHVHTSLVRSGRSVMVFDAPQHETVAKPDTFAYTLEWYIRDQRADEVVMCGIEPPLRTEIVQLASAAGVPVVEILAPGLWGEGEVAIEQVRIDTEQFCAGESIGEAISVLVVADASRARSEYVAALADNFRVAVYGSGWNAFPELDAVTHGPLPYRELPNLLRRAHVTVALERLTNEPQTFWSPVSSAVRTLESLAVGVPCVVPTSLSSYSVTASMPSYNSPQSLVEAVALALQSREPLSNAAHRSAGVIAAEHALRIEPVTDPPRVTVTKDGPRVSVFTAVYNAAEFVAETLDSLLNQRADDLEVLVLDDGSTDGTRAVVAKYESDPRIRVFSQTNIGQVGRFDLVWQSLIPRARGEFIASVDGDDISMPDHFERMLDVLASDDKVGLVHSGGMQIDEHSTVQGPLFGLNFDYDETSQLRHFMHHCLIAHSTILIRRDAFDRVGTFEDGFATDYQYWIKMAKFYRFRYLPEALIHYRIHSGASPRASWRDEGSRTRRYERQRLSMLDLYPSLIGSSDARDFAAAHIDLALQFVRGLTDVDLSFHELDSALALLDGNCPEAEWNRILVLWQLGSQDEANARLTDLENKNPGLMARYSPGGVASFAEGSTVSTVPFRVPESRRKEVKRWDGTSLALRRIMVFPDHKRPDLAVAAINAFAASAAPNSDIELCVATLGLAEDELLNVLQGVQPGIVDLSAAAPVTIERIDDVLFPPATRYAAVIDLSQHADARIVAEELRLAVSALSVNDP
jgi:glycosyltransferase involved in cell wall biosynthesis